jgi:alkanesulfonate monooxygenase SsuD/methylene tetrahydromethanopterin reductase-like flavin-dependent oxidoreductase (luciferase family)
MPGALSFLRLRSGRPGLVPTVEEALAYDYAPHERAFVEQRLAQQSIGGPETVRASLERLLDDTGVDELMVTTMVHDPADRLRSFERLASLPLQSGARLAG